MRTSRKTAIYSGVAEKCIITVYGAPNESITLTNRGGTIYSGIVLNEHGISHSAYEIPSGTYVIKGKVSSEVLPNGRTVEITKDTSIITAYPEGAIFWFGNGDSKGDTLYTGDFVFNRGHGPVDKSKYIEKPYYTWMTSDETTIGTQCTCPNSAGSYYAGTTYSPSYSLKGYSYVNVYASSVSITRAAFGFPKDKERVYWSTEMYFTPTDSDYNLYSMAVPEDRTSGCLAISTFGCKHGAIESIARVKAAWRDTTNNYPLCLKEVKETIKMNETYRYCNHIAGGFGRVNDINYVGQGADVPGAGKEWNAMMVPVSPVDFFGTSRKIKLSLNAWTSSIKNRTFRWSITTSREDESVYAKACGYATESNQLATGTFTPLPAGYGYQTYLLECNDIPPNTPLYIYLWRDNDEYGNIHVMKDVIVSLVYTEE